MNSLQFKKNELKRLCTIVGSKPDEIESIIANIDKHYREWTEQKLDKKTGDFKRYKDGIIKERSIRPPQFRLGVIQTKIKDKILAPIQLPACIHGGVKKRSNISNAKPHQGKKYIFTTDLQEFYPNITFERVYKTFIGLKFSPHFAHWLTSLTTWKYELPQGTPTSTHIANLVFLDADVQLIGLCNANNITYTRFVDDLTFSSPQDFSHLLNEILSIVTSNGFKISYRKTFYNGKQTVTGINIFPNKIDAPEKIIVKADLEKELNSQVKPYTHYVNNIRKTNYKTTLQKEKPNK